MAEKKKPERIIRIGDVSASIFVQMVEGANEDRVFRTVSLQKSYVSNGERQYTGSLSLAELPAAIEVLRMALEYVGDHKEEAIVV
jgi:hypothetical protein